MSRLLLIGLALIVPACAPPLAETATVPPKPLAPTASAQVIGVVPDVNGASTADRIAVR